MDPRDRRRHAVRGGEGLRTALTRNRGPESIVVRAAFLRGLALVYLAAFVSLWSQIEGLVGSQGLLPVRGYLARLSTLGAERYWHLPTLAWLFPSDTALNWTCAAGCVFAALLAVGMAPLPVLAALWALYLSLVVAGQSFLSFQWDMLLLEAGFCALFVAPRTLLPSRVQLEPPPSRAGWWLLRSLLFKLMVLSGAVKLLCLDPTWWGLTALDYHYFTQPLPAPTSWYAHHLPAWLQKLSVLILYALEIGVPFLMFCGRRARVFCFAALVALQVLIAATGNYGFFNLLTVVLCLPLLDDAHLAAATPRSFRGPWLAMEKHRPRPLGARGRLLQRLRIAAVAAVLLVSTLAFVEELTSTVPRDRVGQAGRTILDLSDRFVLSWGMAPLRWIAPLRTINGYGLFRAMTTARPEIVIEGSADGEIWREYAFRWKPGDVRHRPGFVAPHQPRLDWQMWFAALNPKRQEAWLRGLTLRLLEGSPVVLGLLGPNPFPEGPPRYVRWTLWRYEFTGAAERAETGAWWKREHVRTLTEPISLAMLGGP